MRNSCCLSQLSFILLIAASFLPLWAAYNHHTFLNDDTYITLTYAKNLASGRGFVFNHPPPTQGTTTPLLTIAVAGLSVMFPFIEIPTVAVLFTAFCWIGTAWCIFLFRQSWEISVWQASIVGLVILTSGWVAFLGMEAYLFAFLLILSMSLFHSKRHFLAGIVTGLLFLTRGEGVLILFILVAFNSISEWAEKRSFDSRIIMAPFHLGTGFALPVLLWFAYAYVTFGSLLPNTLLAKQAQGQSVVMSRPFLERLVQEWLPLWGNEFRIAQIPMLNVWWFLVIVGTVMIVNQKRKWLMLLIWIVTYIGGYTLLGVSAYWWYQLPIIFVLQIHFAFGLVKCIEFLVSNEKFKTLGVGAAILIFTFSLFYLSKPTINAILNYGGDPRAESYLELSKWIREHTQPHESIAFIEIGYLGYYTNNRIIDLAGLTIPDIVPHVADGDFSWGFWHYEPDYYIYLPDFDWALASIRSNPKFEQCYQPVTTLVGPRDTNFTIYKHDNCEQ